jgi:D-glycero-alpha-D-manno-heptose-7-phosphate kinase
MIITRSPLRISLGGGGTDLPSYYREHSGFLIAAAIDKYVYINVHRRFVDGFLLKYSSLEEAATIDDIKHPIIREALKLVDIRERNLEITSMADIPAGTGLGSSGSFTTALLKAFHALKKNLVHPAELAEQACCIELEKLGEPVGKQDQYISAYGGITSFRFMPDGRVEAAPLKISEETLFNLEDNSQGAGRQEQEVRPGHGGEPSCHQGSREAKPEGAGSGKPRRICAADGRALAAKEGTVAKHEQ